MSDQNLELLPDYQQRIAVLQQLQFIDHTSTVLLKGRVACEVSGLLVLVRRDHQANVVSHTRSDQLC